MSGVQMMLLGSYGVSLLAGDEGGQTGLIIPPFSPVMGTLRPADATINGATIYSLTSGGSDLTMSLSGVRAQNFFQSLVINGQVLHTSNVGAFSTNGPPNPNPYSTWSWGVAQGVLGPFVGGIAYPLAYS